MLQRRMLLATVGLVAAFAVGAEDLLLSPDAARTAASLRDHVAAERVPAAKRKLPW